MSGGKEDPTFYEPVLTCGISPTFLFGQVFSILNGRDHPLNSQEGGQVGGVGTDDDQGEEPPDATHDPGRCGFRIQPRALSWHL